MKEYIIETLWLIETPTSKILLALAAKDQQVYPVLSLLGSNHCYQWSHKYCLVEYWYAMIILSNLLQPGSRASRLPIDHLYHLATNLSRGRRNALYQDVQWANEYLGDCYDELMLLTPNPDFMQLVQTRFTAHGISYTC